MISLALGFFAEMCAFIHYFLSVVSVCLTRLCPSLFEQPSHNNIHEPTCAVTIALYDVAKCKLSRTRFGENMKHLQQVYNILTLLSDIFVKHNSC